MHVSLLELILVGGYALIATLLLPLWLAVRHARQSARRGEQRIFEQLDLILGELHNLSPQRSAVAEAVAVTASAMPVPAKAATPTTSMNTVAPRGYELATRLAKNGATRDELISSCGISRNEAEILLRLYGASNTSRRTTAQTQDATQPTAADSHESLLAVG